MTDVRNGDLRISGGIRTGNWRFGKVTITPVANTPTSASVSGLNLRGAGTITGFATASTSAPGTGVHEVSVSNATATGMTVWLYRTDTAVTDIHWMMWRNRA
ncbi:hypothetical protein [Streptomyces termitum]|uniref:hypothetical protein n=1 Tax=Streptomyces termitum TaxID=67368 RepID=UPI0033A3A68D